MKEEWIIAMRTITNGIYLLTTAHEDRVNGMIASWVTQVSYEPPLIAVAIHPNRYSHGLIEKSASFALHVIKKSQKNLVMQFMGSDSDEKFNGVDWQPGKTGCPLVKGCAAWFECQLRDHVQPGNHSIFIGEVMNAATESDEVILTTRDYRGQYIGRV
jgi:flavin reductase (DIM6/NTAB) family NADH-FMN oxidoreductase RutF